MSKILDKHGNKIVLNEQEQRIADLNQRRMNALGYEVNITTLTTIAKKITEQKFFEIAPADYLPVRVGEGAWSTNLVTYRSFSLGDDFMAGVINTGSNNDRLAAADAGVDSVTVKVSNWAKSIHWSLPDLQLAAKSGNWDLVTTKEKARKKNWDLGIQKIAFLGGGQPGVLGLLNQAGIETNTTFLTKAISTMTPSELKAFCAGILEKYRANCNRTAWPTHFIIPESDYLGLAAPSSADFPLKSVLAVLEETFKIMTKKPDFKILPLAYADAAYNAAAGINKQCYVLLNYEEESLRMDIPVDYTNTLANSIDNFSFQNVGYGQFTGVQAYRPKELIYFQF
jgi:hypothetical protein